jgi:hypothetical protein
MNISEEYLKEHNIKSISLISEDVQKNFFNSFVIYVDNEIINISISDDYVDLSNVYGLIKNTVFEYERNKKTKERKLKLDKILKIKDYTCYIKFD